MSKIDLFVNKHVERMQSFEKWLRSKVAFESDVSLHMSWDDLTHVMYIADTSSVQYMKDAFHMFKDFGRLYDTALHSREYRGGAKIHPLGKRETKQAFAPQSPPQSVPSPHKQALQEMANARERQIKTVMTSLINTLANSLVARFRELDDMIPASSKRKPVYFFVYNSETKQTFVVILLIYYDPKDMTSDNNFRIEQNVSVFLDESVRHLISTTRTVRLIPVHTFNEGDSVRSISKDTLSLRGGKKK